MGGGLRAGRQFWREQAAGGDFPGCPVVKTLCFHCRGPWFKPCWGRSHMPRAMAKKKKKKLFSFKVAVVKAIEKAVLKKINSRGKNKTKQKINFSELP